MPTAEYIAAQRQAKKTPIANDLRVTLLFTCPICKRYTIHAPRENRKGHWYVDHKRAPVYQTHFDGSSDFVGLAPEDACFVEFAADIMNIDTTRTVIRVK